ncbi:MAG: hypothetical protein QM785_12005 [Pyrinomonadaceae bacterium]
MRISAFLSIIIVSLAAGSVSAQTVNPAKVKFKGIGLDSTYAQVVKVLGKPDTEDAAKKEECIGGHEKSIKYSAGISFYMMDGDSKGGKTFEVKSFELTAPGYIVSGIQIGDAQAKVKKLWGRKYSTDKDPATGETIWLYAMNDKDGPGSTRIVFKNGKVTMIASDYQVC